MPASPSPISKSFRTTIRIVLLYFGIAILWILFSDQVLAWLTPDPVLLTQLQSYKGIFFVTVTSLLLFFLLHSEVIKLEKEAEKNFRISEEFRLSNQLLSAIVNSSPLAIVTVDDQENVLLWNPAAETMMGWKADEVIGRRLPYLPEELRDEARTLHRRVMQGERIKNLEGRRITRDGRALQVLLSLVPLADVNGQINQAMGVLVDVTPLKKTEEDLRRLSATLEERVKARTAELEALNRELKNQIAERERVEVLLLDQTRRLQAVNQELASFSYSVSHDLRAPLRQIGGYSTLLFEESADQLSPEAQADLKRILSGVSRMNELIDALMELAQVTRTEAVDQEVDLAGVAHEIIAALRSQEPAREVEFDAPPDLPARGDPRLLRILFENLLNNAWKFTGKRDCAKIEVGMSSQSGEVPTYFIRDNGAGFDMTHANRLFSAFQRLHSPDEYPGLGIGLTTVQRIVHRYGGRIWAESEVDHGATFYFTLKPDKEG